MKLCVYVLCVFVLSVHSRLLQILQQKMNFFECNVMIFGIPDECRVTEFEDFLYSVVLAQIHHERGIKVLSVARSRLRESMSPI